MHPNHINGAAFSWPFRMDQFKTPITSFAASASAVMSEWKNWPKTWIAWKMCPKIGKMHKFHKNYGVLVRKSTLNNLSTLPLNTEIIIVWRNTSGDEKCKSEHWTAYTACGPKNMLLFRIRNEGNKLVDRFIFYSWLCVIRKRIALNSNGGLIMAKSRRRKSAQCTENRNSLKHTEYIAYAHRINAMLVIK